MIHFVSGDILLSRAQVLAHGVAPNDPMTHGLALALRPGYPALHKDFHHGCSQQHSKPGTAWMWGGPGGVRVVNLITQEGGYGAGAKPGRASAHNVREARARTGQDGRGRVVHVHRGAAPGHGRGCALPWDDVLPVLEQRLGALAIPVYVYTEYHPGQSAHEPGLAKP